MAFFGALHMGSIAVFVTAMLAVWKLTYKVDRKYRVRVALKDAPPWMRYMMNGVFGYAFVSFFFNITGMPHGSNGSNVSASEWRLFSGQWMAFYSAAFVFLYSAANAKTNGWRCPNGHFIPLGGPWCERCGQQAPHDLRVAKSN